jgi:hypothetical protein
VTSRAYPAGGTGTVTTDGSGVVSTISGLTRVELTPLNLGGLILSDLVNHFAYWKLHRLRIVYVNNANVTNVSVSAPVFAGTVMLGVEDDPPAVATTGGGIMELRSATEFRLDRDWSFDYIPTGPQAQWLFTDKFASTAQSTARQVDAGSLEWQSGLTSSWHNTVVGRLHFEYDVSLKGARPRLTPSLTASAPLVRAVMEEKKETGVESKTTISAKDEPSVKGAKASQPLSVDSASHQAALQDLDKVLAVLLQRQPGALSS